jgi:ATP-dependent protease HslVU (ClpYQ) ATPase subunit
MVSDLACESATSLLCRCSSQCRDANWTNGVFVHGTTLATNAVIERRGARTALIATEGVELTFTEDAVDAIADAAVAVNGSVENIGARRLQTILEKVVEEISFTAGDGGAPQMTIDGDYVRSRVGALAADADLSRFIL